MWNRNVADDVLFQEHFADLDYLDWFRAQKYWNKHPYRLESELPWGLMCVLQSNNSQNNIQHKSDIT